jgi:cytochrome c biogenesis protein ResB
VKQVLSNAMIQVRVEPSNGGSGVMGENVVSGIRAYLINSQGEKGEPGWIPSGQARLLRLGNTGARIGFGLKLQTLNFGIQLTKFEVPHDEGTETPSDFRSTVLFTDFKTGKTTPGLIHMNHPASYPTGFWRSVLGTNYKFSQAQWNPRDQGETTLQVLHDPGWPLKWSGSLLICAGIAIMFYLKPKTASKTKARKPSAAAAVTI